MLFLFFIPSIIAEEFCQSCSVFSYIDAQLQCSNPSICAGEFCYHYILSDRRQLFLSGCAEDVGGFPFRDMDSRTLCRTENHVGLCVCRAGERSCLLESNETLFAVETGQIEMDALSQNTAGYRIDYVRARVLQMHLDGYPLKFRDARNVKMISTCDSPPILLPLLVALVRLLF